MRRPFRLALAAGAVLVLAAVVLWQLASARTFQLIGTPVSAVPTGDCVIALTFDDGPVPQATDELLAVLAAHEARATFYLIGREVARFPEAARSIVAAGHEVGNHSWSHRRMLPRAPADLRDELERTDAALRVAGWAGPITFRPPYGKKLLVLPWLLRERSQRTVTWSIEPDADPGADAARITAQVLAQARPGAIVLLHAMYRSRAATRAALPAMIDGLQARGYALVTVGELLSRHASVALDEREACRGARVAGRADSQPAAGATTQ